jgi:hypothetical protein
MGVTMQGTTGAVDTAPRRHRRHGPAALGLLTVASLGLSVLGIGTGDGPLGPPDAYVLGVSGDVGRELTDGVTMLDDDGWFAAHVESIRPLPVDDASRGLTITGIELARPGAGPGVRSAAEGYTLLAGRRSGGAGSQAALLVHARITQPGTWSYRGYEITYRSGLVRHHMVVDAQLTACTPAGRDCSKDTAP